MVKYTLKGIENQQNRKWPPKNCTIQYWGQQVQLVSVCITQCVGEPNHLPFRATLHSLRAGHSHVGIGACCGKK